MAERVKCETCNREFKDESGLAAHNAAKHNSLSGKPKERGMAIWVYSGLAIFVIAVLAYLYLGNSSPQVTNVSSSQLGVQKIVISMQNYNYYPNTITVEAGKPVEITLDSSVGGCYRSFNIPSLGVSYRSSNPGDKITFTPTKKGSFEFACSMRMGRGTIIVK